MITLLHGTYAIRTTAARESTAQCRCAASIAALVDAVSLSHFLSVNNM